MNDWSCFLPFSPHPYRHWLTYTGSLTRRLGKYCKSVRVERLYQGLQKPILGEAGVIGIKPRQLAFVREVCLYCNNEPVVFAHSVIAVGAIRGDWHWLSKMKHQSLGEKLFVNHRIQRQPLAYKKLNAFHPLYQRVCRKLTIKQSDLWARRSVFILKAKPILVTEVFLPDITKLSKPFLP